MSRELTLKTEKTKLEEKFFKSLRNDEYQEFIDSHAKMSKEELEARLLDLAKTQQGILNTKNSDGELEKAKAEKSRIESKYRDMMSGNKDLTRYVALVISERFGDELMDVKAESEEDKDEED